MLLNELVKLTTLWTTGPWRSNFSCIGYEVVAVVAGTILLLAGWRWWWLRSCLLLRRADRRSRYCWWWSGDDQQWLDGCRLLPAVMCGVVCCLGVAGRVCAEGGSMRYLSPSLKKTLFKHKQGLQYNPSLWKKWGYTGLHLSVLPSRY